VRTISAFQILISIGFGILMCYIVHGFPLHRLKKAFSTFQIIFTIYFIKFITLIVAFKNGTFQFHYEFVLNNLNDFLMIAANISVLYVFLIVLCSPSFMLAVGVSLLYLRFTGQEDKLI
jgi:hypothetical protein